MQQVADGDAIDREIDHCAIAFNAGGIGLEAGELADGAAGAALGAGLEPAPDEDQRDDDGGGFEIDVARAGGKNRRGEECHGGIGPSRAGPHGDEGVHVRAAAQQKRHALKEEAATGPDQDEARQDELQ